MNKKYKNTKSLLIITFGPKISRALSVFFNSISNLTNGDSKLKLNIANDSCDRYLLIFIFYEKFLNSEKYYQFNIKKKIKLF